MPEKLAADASNLTFLQGGGEMGRRMRDLEWRKTPLGAADTWPQSLRSTVSMPLVDGFQFIARVRRHHNPLVREVPAAALTAYARSEDRTKALRAGFQIHLAKPIDPAELVTTIASLARRFVIRPSDRPADLV